jgi:hypothetical protein
MGYRIVCEVKGCTQAEDINNASLGSDGFPDRTMPKGWCRISVSWDAGRLPRSYIACPAHPRPEPEVAFPDAHRQVPAPFDPNIRFDQSRPDSAAEALDRVVARHEQARLNVDDVGR